MSDAVHHPSHYTAYKGLEIIDLTEQMNFNRGNAVKYIARAGLKSSETEIQDLEKAQWYIAREIQRLRATEPSSNDSAETASKEQPTVPLVCPSCIAPWMKWGFLYWHKPNENTITCSQCLASFSLSEFSSPPDRTKCPKCKNEWGEHRTSHFVDMAADVITCYSCGGQWSNRKFGPTS